MAALPLAVVLSLAAEPRCGARPDIEPARIAAVATQESGLDPLIIGANADPARGLPHQVFRSVSLSEAQAKAASLIAAGRSIDLGLVGINASNLQRDGLTLATAFDACSSIRAGYHHLAGDFEAAAWATAHRLYNCGRSDCGAAYASSVQSIIARVRVAAADAVPTNPDDVAAPAPRRVPPGLEDALHIAPAPSDDNDGGLSDALHHNIRKDHAE